MKILAVDDEVDTETLFKQRFRKEIKEHTVDVAFANSGKEALTYLHQHSKEHSLCFQTLICPG